MAANGAGWIRLEAIMTATSAAYPDFLLALCIWREARGAERRAKEGVKHVVLNRVARPVGPFIHCPDVVTNILAPGQFSSFTKSDPNATRLPSPKDTGDWKAWLECCDVVDADQADPTGGANCYFTVGIQPPDWALPEKQTCQIGAFRFFRL